MDTQLALLSQQLGLDGPLTLQDLMDAEQRLSELPNQMSLDDETDHYFAPGVYCRQLFIPEGCLLSGKVHKTEHLNVMCGDLTVFTEDGEKRLTGWHVIKSAPGTKRIGFAHSNTFWMTIHPTEETDLAKLEAQLIVPMPRPALKGESA